MFRLRAFIVICIFLSIVQAYSYKHASKILSYNNKAIFKDYRIIKQNHYKYDMHIKAASSLPSMQSFVQTLSNNKLSIVSKFTQSIINNLSIPVKALIVLTTGLMIRFKTKIFHKFQSATNNMELGWLQRGTSGSFKRTIEVWGFAINYIFKYVRTL